MNEISGLVTLLSAGDPTYPAELPERLGTDTPPGLLIRGDPSLLDPPLHALFCSVEPPPDLVPAALDLARELAAEGRPCIGGFQSPVEKLMLEVLLQGATPVVICLARSIAGTRLSGSWRRALEGGRLLLMSDEVRRRRADSTLATRRNRTVAALASGVSVIHASPGGRVYHLVAEILEWGLPVRTPAHPANAALALLGAVSWNPGGSGAERPHSVEGDE